MCALKLLWCCSCFRYEVHDDRGNDVGFITADRAMSHPALRWQISQVNDLFGISDLIGDYASVKDALAALEHRNRTRSEWTSTSSMNRGAET
jgi:hypothetical protein